MPSRRALHSDEVANCTIEFVPMSWQHMLIAGAAPASQSGPLLGHSR